MGAVPSLLKTSVTHAREFVNTARKVLLFSQFRRGFLSAFAQGAGTVQYAIIYICHIIL